ncbi:xylulose kinase [Vibrio maritimus]|uniref:Xylulose kinase n=1 Tax=Vibrio maritimus TaxID=990268 RepID=A0A090T5G0_9VIBR|nr:xylulose kinase [Vibrio maritimus]
MYIGIDLGTSGVKSIAMTEQGEILASCTIPWWYLALNLCGQNKILAPGGKQPVNLLMVSKPQ